jgi:hypothetical protein
MQYEQKLFAFLDILGFSNAINYTKTNPKVIENIYNLLKSTRADTSVWVTQGYELLGLEKPVDFNDNKYQSRMFSDSITLSCPYESSNDFFTLCIWVIIHQCKIWEEYGYFIRGGIVYSAIIEENEIMFGPAMIEAYELENEKADWHRILISANIIQKLSPQEKEKYFAQFIRNDRDFLFLDYLKDSFRLYSANFFQQKLSISTNSIDMIKHHKLQIESQIKANTGNERILNKYRKLSLYHNSVIDEYSGVAQSILANRQEMRDIIKSISHEAKSETGLVSSYTSPYTTNNMMYIDKLPVLGIALRQIMNSKECKGIKRSDPNVFTGFLINKSPHYLKELNDELNRQKIDLGIFN